MRTLVLAALVCGLCASVSATVLHVPDPYPTIQAGIDAATEGDTVLVADGTYTGDGNRDLDFGGVNMVVMSENGPAATVIDCEQAGRAFFFHGQEDLNSVLQGFTMTNGHYGSADGGAIRCEHSSPTIRGNVFAGNAVVNFGGAISCAWSSPLIEGNVIRENTANGGGGISTGGVGCSPTIMGNIITNNTARPSWRGGGGINVENNSTPVIEGNTIVRNTAAHGGGLFCDEASATIRNCVFWGDSPEEICVLSGSATVSYCDIEGGWAGEGNIDVDPRFVSGPQGDYYLSQTLAGQPKESPCVDAGAHAAAVPEGTTRTDHVCDVWPVDMGYHYTPCTSGPTPLLWVNVAPETTQIARGEDLWFAVDVVNVTDSTLVFDAWVDAYKLGGVPYAGNPVLGPVGITVGGGHGLYGIRRHVRIPLAAPYGSPYKLCVSTGEHPDSIWGDDCFEFAIVPPPAE